jgi:hypothetical protein
LAAGAETEGAAVVVDESMVDESMAAAESETPIYRGLGVNHFAIDEARQGVAIPADLLGHTDVLLHNAGFTYESSLTSWSTSLSVAQKFASEGGPGGVVLETTLEAWIDRAFTSPDAYNEIEILLQGRIDNLKVSNFP